MDTSETLPVTTGKGRALARIVDLTAASLSKATLIANPWSSNPRSRPMPPVNREMTVGSCQCICPLPSSSNVSAARVISVGDTSSTLTNFWIVLGRRAVNPCSARYIVLSSTRERLASSRLDRANASRRRLRFPFIAAPSALHERSNRCQPAFYRGLALYAIDMHYVCTPDVHGPTGHYEPPYPVAMRTELLYTSPQEHTRRLGGQ